MDISNRLNNSLCVPLKRLSNEIKMPQICQDKNCIAGFIIKLFYFFQLGLNI